MSLVVLGQLLVFLGVFHRRGQRLGHQCMLLSCFGFSGLGLFGTLDGGRVAVPTLDHAFQRFLLGFALGGAKLFCVGNALLAQLILELLDLELFQGRSQLGRAWFGVAGKGGHAASCSFISGTGAS